jgi:hypothetical protein
MEAIMANGLEHLFFTSLKVIFQKCRNNNHDDVGRFDV